MSLTLHPTLHASQSSGAVAIPSPSVEGRPTADCIVAIARARNQRSPREQSRVLLQRWKQSPQRIDNAKPDLNQPSSLQAIQPTPHFVASGIVWDGNGSVVTSYRALDDPRENRYWIGVGREEHGESHWFPAIVVAADPYSDLAVLRFEKETPPLLTVSAATSDPDRNDQITIAEPVTYYAFREGPAGTIEWEQGEARWERVACIPKPRWESHDMTSTQPAMDSLERFGILASIATERPTAAAGGGVFDSKGNLLAMSVRFPRAEWDENSILVFPCDKAFHRVVHSLIDGQLPEFGFLGIQPEEPPVGADSSESVHMLKGARIKTVVRGMPGDMAGVRDGDTITAIEGRPVTSRDSLFRELSRYHANAQVTINLLRYAPGASQPDSLTLQATLSKKHIATRRPAYSIKPEPAWRGMRVEYSTALSPEMMRTPLRVKGGLAPGSIAVLNVEPQTPAWRAGLRSGQLISTVEGQVVTSPQDFYRLMETFPRRSVRMQVISYRERLEEVVVPIE